MAPRCDLLGQKPLSSDSPMKTSRPKVAVIGGGIFGLSAAFELTSDFDVTVFEQNQELLKGATYANHNRHHYGYHYPRSYETARQCLESRHSFESVYGPCLVWDFKNYYAVSKTDTKTTPENYLKFCKDLDLYHKEEWPEEGAMSREKVALSLRVKEAVYDFNTLNRLVQYRLRESPKLSVLLNHRVTAGKLGDDGSKVLTVRHDAKTEEQRFDFVINATYASLNQFCDWFGFAPRQFQFNLQELAVVELPLQHKSGMTVMDGEFPSFIPLGFSNFFLLAHVVTSMLRRDSSFQTQSLIARSLNIESNWSGVQASCALQLPVVSQARYQRSIFVDRVVDAARSSDDARVTELMDHGSGCWSIFAAKVISCVSIAKKLREGIEAQVR
jgi:hypothetical protein